ncbi:unnamed protein product, partial [marine sediment metagenome]
ASPTPIPAKRLLVLWRGWLARERQLPLRLISCYNLAVMGFGRETTLAAMS